MTESIEEIEFTIWSKRIVFIIVAAIIIYATYYFFEKIQRQASDFITSNGVSENVQKVKSLLARIDNDVASESSNNSTGIFKHFGDKLGQFTAIPGAFFNDLFSKIMGRMGLANETEDE